VISTREAMAMLGVSRKLWDKIKCELRPVQYTPGGKLFYKRLEVEALIERKRKSVYPRGQFMNPEIAGWF
jgi:hypothetical protein